MKRIFIALSLAACGGSTPNTKPDAAPKTATITAYVHGALAQSDLEKARMQHDALVDGSAAAAKSAGDVGHKVLLGTGEPAPDRKDEFLGIDEWLTIDGPRQVYSDPSFQAGFGALFAQPGAPELYVRHPDWHTWGDLSMPAGGTYWFMIVKGHLAKDSIEENKRAHDAVASGFQAAAMKAGDIAHVPHLSVDDPRVFFNVDVSTDHEGMLAVLSDPAFQQQFGALFDAPPEVHIYRATNWKQW